MNHLKTGRDIFNWLRNELKNSYSASELDSVARMITEEWTGLSYTDILSGVEISQEIMSLDQWKLDLKRLKEGEPVQYVLGKAYFYGLDFKVSRGALIPRGETEELVEAIAKQAARGSSVIDIGTGSGCIPVSLKKCRNDLSISAVDISSEALNLAEENARIHKVDVDFSRRDILNESLKEKYDIIVSNPPYIPNNEKMEMMKRVTDYEPSIALFVPDNDPLLFYRRILELADYSLNPNGLVFFEIHESQGTALLKWSAERNWKGKIQKDINGKDRIAIFRR